MSEGAADSSDFGMGTGSFSGRVWEGRLKMSADWERRLGMATPMDDNAEILRLLQGRLALGRQRYGQGVRVDDDVSRFTNDGSDEWETMMLEEALDGMIYAAACLLRVKRRTGASRE